MNHNLKEPVEVIERLLNVRKMGIFCRLKNISRGSGSLRSLADTSKALMLKLVTIGIFFKGFADIFEKTGIEKNILLHCPFFVILWQSQLCPESSQDLQL